MWLRYHCHQQTVYILACFNAVLPPLNVAVWSRGKATVLLVH